MGSSTITARGYPQPMSRSDEYRRALGSLDEWEPFLLDRSGLPGPRANIELGQVVADLGTRHRFDRLLAWTPDRVPAGSREEFLAFCGAIGLGRLAAEADRRALRRLRSLASDPRWRVREAAALGLQRLGAADMGTQIAEMRSWSTGTDLVRRAAVAALCEPELLRSEQDARAVLAVLDRITRELSRSTDRRSDGFAALRKALGYGWSVAVAAGPSAAAT